MFKKLIASIAALGLCTGLLANANINKVNAGDTSSTSTTDTTSDSVTLTKLYYFDFTNTDYVQKMKDNNGYYFPTCLNTGTVDNNYSFSFTDMYSGYDGYTSPDSNTQISATGSSIDKYNNMTTFTNAFNFNAAFSTAIVVPSSTTNFTISINFVTSVDGNVKIYNNLNAALEYNDAKTNSMQSVIINGSSISGNNNKYIFTNSSMKDASTHIDVEIAEILITVEEESSSVTAKAYSQHGTDKSDSNNTVQYARFITVVNGVSSVYDLSKVQYKFTFNKKEIYVTPIIVDEIYDGNTIMQADDIENVSTYHFNNKSTTKYLLYVMAYSDKDHANQYTGNLQCDVVISKKTLATTTRELSN